MFHKQRVFCSVIKQCDGAILGGGKIERFVDLSRFPECSHLMGCCVKARRQGIFHTENRNTVHHEY